VINLPKKPSNDNNYTYDSDFIDALLSLPIFSKEEYDPVEIISVFEELTNTLEGKLWIPTRIYQAYSSNGNKITGRKQAPISNISKEELDILVYDKKGNPILDHEGNYIYISSEMVGDGEDDIKVATGTLYHERLEIYAEFIDNVREMRLTLYHTLAHNKDFEEEFWNILFSIKDSDFVRFTKIFLNMFFYTYNPMFDESEGNASTPFIMFKFQEDMIRDAYENTAVLVLKPRGFGFTWLKIGFDIVKMLFIHGWQGIVISRVQDDLDIKGDRVQTIFGRMRYAFENMPYFIAFYGQEKQRFIKLSNNSQYMGKSSNVDSARSMRGDDVELEEAGAMEKLTEIIRAIKSVSKNRIVGGSVKGTDNGFYEFYQSALLDGSYKIVFWKVEVHPLYSAPDWLEMEKTSYGADLAGFYQEVMVDFFAGVDGQVFRTLHNGFLLNKEQQSRFDLTDPHWIKCTSIDPAFGSSKTAIWTFYFNTQSRTYYYTGYYEMINTNYKKVLELLKKIDHFNAYTFIDEHANKRDKDGTTLVQMFFKYGLKNIIPVSNQHVMNSCFFANALINNNQVWFKEDGVNIKTKRQSGMKVLGFSKLLKYRFNNKNGISKNSKGIIDKDGKNDDAGDSFRYSHSASQYFGKGFSRNTTGVEEEIHLSI